MDDCAPTMDTQGTPLPALRTSPHQAILVSTSGMTWGGSRPSLDWPGDLRHHPPHDLPGTSHARPRPPPGSPAPVLRPGPARRCRRTRGVREVHLRRTPRRGPGRRPRPAPGRPRHPRRTVRLDRPPAEPGDHPLGRGETAHYAPYDWHARRFATPRALPPAPVVLVEGVGAGRRAVRPFLAGLLWMELPREEAWTRGRVRDGAEQRDFWDGWVEAEREHFAKDPSRPHAGFLVRQLRMGYEVLSGPSGTVGPDREVTHGDGPPAVC